MWYGPVVRSAMPALGKPAVDVGPFAHRLPVAATALAAMLALATAATGAAAAFKPIVVPGVLEPQNTVTVGSFLSGVIQDVTCDFNSVVTKGQVCARIDARRFMRSVEQARAAVSTAKSMLELHKVELTYATAKLERNQPLFQRGVVSRDVYEALLANHDKLQHQVRLDSATIEQRNAEVELAMVNLSYADIRAPIDGIVLARNISAGEIVQTSLQSPVLFVIASDLHTLRLTASVEEAAVGAARVGEVASFTVKAYPNQVFPARIVQVRYPNEARNGQASPTPSPSPARYSIVLDVDNAELLLSPGMNAEVHIGSGS